MYGLHFGCWVLARALCERRLLELGLVLPEDGRYREPMGVGVETYGLAAGQKTQSAIRVRMARSHEKGWAQIFGETEGLAIERCHTKMPSGKARKFAPPSMPPTAAVFAAAKTSGCH
jgi:hypothetical protein